MIGCLIVLCGLLRLALSVPPAPPSPPSPVKDEWMWFNIEGELLDFLLLFGSDLVHSPVELEDASFSDGTLSGVSVVKLYDGRPYGSPVLKARGFNEFSVEATLDVNMKLNVDNLTTGELAEPAAVTIFDVRVKVKLAVMDLFSKTCTTRLSASALSYGQIMILLPRRKLVLDEKAQPPYMRSVLQDAVLDYLNESFFHFVRKFLNFDSYICNR